MDVQDRCVGCRLESMDTTHVGDAECEESFLAS